MAASSCSGERRRRRNQRDSGDSQQQSACDEVKLHRLDGLMPQESGGAGVEDRDRAANSTVLFSVDDAHSVEAERTVVLSIEREVEVAGSVRSTQLSQQSGGRTGRVAQHAAGGTQHLVDILRGQDQLGGVNGDIVLGVFGVAHRSQQRVGEAMQHDVEGSAAAMHLVADGGGGEERGAEHLGQQNSADQLTAERMRLYRRGFHSCRSGASRR
jgi:hypothetical protein